jgi:hypothetical protein
MTTKKELVLKALNDEFVLKRVWIETFNMVSAEDFDQRGIHPPPGLRRFLNEVFNEGISTANEFIQEQIEKGEVSQDEAGTYSVYVATQLGVVIATRMYELGNLLARDLPFSKLAPCTCHILLDEDIADLLKEDGK